MWPRESLRAGELRAALSGSHIGNEIVVVDETTSTNDLAWQMAQQGKATGFVVFAERQTAGRGQRGNQWESAPHLGLWFSILLRPQLKPANSSRLTTWAAATVAQTIKEETGIAAHIKMPNDIHIGQRKVGGVLVEMRVEKSGAYAAIVGIGINVNHAAADFPRTLSATAGSLAIAGGKQIDRQSFAVALLRNLDRSYDELFVA
jgi:BirA family transcriptional regulator, biotin operon repressor / biotin---[acetyl-CoA-carboxylase] ligase